jgi:hypothetical protein
MDRDHRSGIMGESPWDSPRDKWVLTKHGSALTKPEVAEGCAACVMVIISESCDKSCEGSRVRSREGSHARSRGNEMRDHVMELGVRDDGMAI